MIGMIAIKAQPIITLTMGLTLPHSGARSEPGPYPVAYRASEYSTLVTWAIPEARLKLSENEAPDLLPLWSGSVLATPPMLNQPANLP
jgi:hypothetical protein